MTRQPHDPDYLDWLQGQVALPPDGRSYRQLLEALNDKEFVWLIPNDDNRVADGLDLRREYFHEYGEMPGEEGATVLEVIVALSRRITFLADGEAEQWAWCLIKNLEVHKFWDPLTARKIKDLDDKLDCLIWRTYHMDGQGGFFPLAWPEEDQSKVELWYQMNSYIEELPEM